MVRYALNLLEVDMKDLPVTEGDYFYDILVFYLIHGVEFIINHGLYHTYLNVEENLNVVRGKILLNEHLSHNSDRTDKVYCGFSELTPDILENQIIKFTLFSLSNCKFTHEGIASELRTLYRRLDNVELKSMSSNDCKWVVYNTLNEHYRPIINLCELLLRDSSVNLESTGQKSSFQFLIEMDNLFQKFIANFLKKSLGESNIRIQKIEYSEIKVTRRPLFVRPDIMLYHKNLPVLILDTKYKTYLGENPDSHDIAQMESYSIATGIKQCVIVCLGACKSKTKFLKENINIHIISINLLTDSTEEFEEICSKFRDDIYELMNRVYI